MNNGISTPLIAINQAIQEVCNRPSTLTSQSIGLHYLYVSMILQTGIALFTKSSSIWFGHDKLAANIYTCRLVIMLTYTFFKQFVNKKPLPKISIVFEIKLRIWFAVQIVGCMIQFFFFPLATSYIKVGMVMTISHFAPYTSNFFSAAFLKTHRLSPVYVYGFISSCLGLTLMFIFYEWNDQTEIPLVRIICGFISAILSCVGASLVEVANKILSKSANPEDVSYDCLTISSLFAVILLIVFAQDSLHIYLDPKFFFFALGVGSCSFFGQHYYNRAAKLIDIRIYSYVRYAQIIICAVYDCLLWHTSYNFFELIGMGTIVTSIFYSVIVFG